jgi:spore coat protein H
MAGSKIPWTVLAALVGSAAGCTGNPGGSDLVDESERVFDTSALHEIRIEVAPEYLPALEYDHEQRVPCTFTFDGTRLEHVTIRQKGLGTHAGSLYTKPSFSVRFDELVRGQTLHGLDKLILNNTGMDPTLVHEHLGFDLYQRAGIPSRRTAHAVVTLSGMRSGEQTYGVYVMVEAVDEKLLERHFGEAHDNGNLFEDEEAGDFAEDPRAIDLKDEDEPGRSHERLVEFADFLQTATDDELLEHLDEYIDLERALDGFAIDLLAQHGDGFWLAAHNYYLYEHPADHRFVFLPHGMDMLFEATGRSCGMVPVPPHLPTLLGERVATHPELRARVEQAIARLLDEVWDVPLMEARIDAVGALLDASSHDEPAFVAERAAHHASREALKRLLRNTAQAWRPAAASQCGDGVLEGSELCASMCEDGNRVDGDGCSAECLFEYCGDWKVQPGLGEVCEGAEGCSWDCLTTIVCGDGIRDETEQCDDGNAIDDDTCNNYCTPNCAHEMRAGEEYAFCPVAVSHERTRDICGTLYATPALPRSPEEQEWLVERSGELAAGPWWIGLDSYAGQWWASDGLPVTWLGWGAGQPDETPEELPGAGDPACALLDPDMDGAWNDHPCDEEHPVVCKMF